MTTSLPIAVVHLDESCLGNGREGSNPGGAGALIEVRLRSGTERRDVFLHASDTTNNRMAITSAIMVLRALASKERRLRVLLVSDSQYLVKGMREWVPGWKARGWRRKAGPIENLELWQDLDEAARLHDAQFTWVRGHAGRVKNEYVNDLAVMAATEQRSSEGAVASGFEAWLEGQRAKGRYLEYDPEAAFHREHAVVASGRLIPLALAGAWQEAE